MSDDEFATRKVGSEEMGRLQVLLDKIAALPEVRIDVTADLYVRVDAVLPLCELTASTEERRFVEAVNQIFEAGLREYEARLAMDD